MEELTWLWHNCAMEKQCKTRSSAVSGQPFIPDSGKDLLVAVLVIDRCSMNMDEL